LRLVDFDVIRESNFNRQLLAVEPNLGKTKVAAAAERVRQINPACAVDERIEFVEGELAAELLGGGLDAAVDAIDSLTPKVNLIHASLRAGVPLISCMGAASRLDPFAIKVGDLSATTFCPLARLVRKKLRKLGITEGVRCVYSDEPPRKSAISPELEVECFQRGRMRRPVGSISFITGMFGLHAARETVNTILREPCGA
jgi:tRNA A37 threonylcarbamoyladenosine dehydratase